MFKLSQYNYVKAADDAVYIYNYIFRSFLKLDKDIWKVLENNEYKKLEQSSIEILLEYGIICPRDVDERLIMMSFLKSKLYSKKSLGIILSMTSLCNFSCNYCYEDCRKKDVVNKKYIDRKTIDKVYNFIKEYVRQNNTENISIAYFGGEPLMDKMCLEYAIKRFSSIDKCIVQHTLITNGFDMTEDFIEEVLIKHNVVVQITLDGPKDMHNKMRKSEQCNNTFDIIVENLRKLCSIKPQNCILRVNVLESISEKYITLFDYLAEDDILKKVGGITISPIFDGQLKSNCETNNVTDKIIKLYEYAIGKKLNVSINIEYGPCMCNAMSIATIDENMKLYDCPGTLYKKSVGEIQGTTMVITDNSWYEKRLKPSSCIESCEYGPLCFGPCILNGTCHKESIKKLLPLFIEQKISKYS